MNKSIDDITIEEFMNMEFEPRFCEEGWQILRNINKGKCIFGNFENSEAPTHEEFECGIRMVHVLINLGLLELNITKKGIERLEKRNSKSSVT